MDVALCNDNALGNIYFTCGANDFAGAAALYVAGFAAGSVNADRPCVACRKLYLCVGANRSENRNLGERAL